MPRMTGTRRDGNERGAVLVHMAIAMVAVMAFVALVIDYGIFWVARRQAQNSADSGALAGAMALAFDDPTDLTQNGPAQRNARGAALANIVWGLQPDVQFNTDITFPTCPDGVPDRCVRVDAYRASGTYNGLARNNPLPTFFGRLVGVDTQNVRATATAQVLMGNSTTCLKPFGIADKWDEYDIGDGSERESEMPGMGPNGEDYYDPDIWEGPVGSQTFDKYDSKTPEDDYYVPSSPGVTGTGYRIFEDDTQTTYCCDYGKEIRLKAGAQDQIPSGWFAPLRIECPGGDCYRDAIMGCVSTATIGEVVNFDTQPGNLIGPTRQGVLDLIAQDPGAQWYPPGSIVGSPPLAVCQTYGCVYSPTYGVNAGPRVGAYPVFNPDAYLGSGPEGMESVPIINLIGLFIESVQGNGMGQEVVARLVSVPGEFATGGTVDQSSSFLLTIRLIR